MFRVRWEKLVSASGRSRELWNSWPVAVVLVLGGAIAAIWISRSSPLPGVAIAVLGAIAAVMSLRPEMSTLEKFGWILIVTWLLRTEVRAIRVDRADAIRQALADRQKQDDDFAKVLQEQHDDFSATANSLTQAYSADQQHFGTTVAKLNNASRQVQKAVEQTRPVASVQVKEVDSGVDANRVILTARVNYQNEGRDTARAIFVMAKRYFVPSDTLAAERAISPQLEKAWIEHLKVQRPGNLVAPDETKYLDFSFEPYSMQDLADLKAGKLQMYVIYRIQFSDETGTWISDKCDHISALGGRRRAADSMRKQDIRRRKPGLMLRLNEIAS